jgi:RimJ/RimL family protein N-acetyltransferase
VERSHDDRGILDDDEQHPVILRHWTPPGSPAMSCLIKEPEEVVLDDGRRVLVRPLQAADREVYAEGVAALSPRSRYLRFASPQPQMGERQLDLMTQPDGQRHVAYIALTPDGSVGVGVARYIRAAAANAAEVAIAVADEWQGHGLGGKLLCLLIAHARAAELETLFAVTLSENGVAHGLARGAGFAASPGAGIYTDYERAVADGTPRAGCAA